MFVRIRYSHALRFVPGRELVEGRVRLRERLLHHVLGVGRVAGHPQGRRVQLVQVLQRVGLESRVALFGASRWPGRPPEARRAVVGEVESGGRRWIRWGRVGRVITYESTGANAAADRSAPQR